MTQYYSSFLNLFFISLTSVILLFTPFSFASTPPSSSPKFNFRTQPAQWGFALSVTPTSNSSLTLQGEYQPGFIQKLGILGIGFSATNYDSNFIQFPAFGIGGQLRYQLRYFQEQFLVPHIGYSFEYLQYKYLNTGSKKESFHRSYFAGIALLLNTLEPSAATAFFKSYGIKRSYLICDYKNNYLFSSQKMDKKHVVYLGVRFEF